MRTFFVLFIWLAVSNRSHTLMSTEYSESVTAIGDECDRQCVSNIATKCTCLSEMSHLNRCCKGDRVFFHLLHVSRVQMVQAAD